MEDRYTVLPNFRPSPREELPEPIPVINRSYCACFDGHCAKAAAEMVCAFATRGLAPSCALVAVAAAALPLECLRRWPLTLTPADPADACDDGR
jgi:hypothetical protein